MSNIYEALEQACREDRFSSVSNQLALRDGGGPGLGLGEEMSWLHHRLDFVSAQAPLKVIQFLGCGGKEGVSTVAREFARSVVQRHGRKVLVLNSAHEDPTRRINLCVTCEYGLLDQLEKGELEDQSFFRLGDSSLYFAPVSFQASFVASSAALLCESSLWSRIKEEFDLVVIDSPAELNSTESVLISCNTDGVILVIEADRTRRDALAGLAARIADNGGTVLGAVLNKRRYHIPGFLYRRLFSGQAGR